MAKQDNLLTTIVKIGALIAGAWLAIEALKAFSKPKTVYSCPKCKADIEYGVPNCHNCGVSLSWGKETSNG